MGRTVLAGELLDRAAAQRAFFDASGGGVTLTGGEPAMQPQFAEAILILLKAAGVHTAVETSGMAHGDVYERLAPVTDLFLYDLKGADDALHRRDTGVSNRLILANLRRLVDAGADVLVRVPCIPGRNATPAIIAEIARAAARCGVRRVSLLPYNAAAPGKYAWLQRDYPLAGAQPQTPDEMRHLHRAAASAGLEIVPP